MHVIGILVRVISDLNVNERILHECLSSMHFMGPKIFAFALHVAKKSPRVKWVYKK